MRCSCRQRLLGTSRWWSFCQPYFVGHLGSSASRWWLPYQGNWSKWLAVESEPGRRNHQIPARSLGCKWIRNDNFVVSVSDLLCGKTNNISSPIILHQCIVCETCVLSSGAPFEWGAINTFNEELWWRTTEKKNSDYLAASLVFH